LIPLTSTIVIIDTFFILFYTQSNDIDEDMIVRDRM